MKLKGRLTIEKLTQGNTTAAEERQLLINVSTKVVVVSLYYRSGIITAHKFNTDLIASNFTRKLTAIKDAISFYLCNLKTEQIERLRIVTKWHEFLEWTCYFFRFKLSLRKSRKCGN